MNVIYYMPLFLKKQALASNDKALQDFCELFKVVSPNACLIDRTGALETPFPIQVLYEIPTQLDALHDYDTLCILRAKEILASSKKIMIFYSGGLDSTVVVLSFLIAIKAGHGSFDQITIAATPHSIVENPEFWFARVLPNFRLASANAVLQQVSSDDVDCYVLGENADQLFGSDIILGDMTLLDKPSTADELERFISSKGVAETAKPYVHRVLSKLKASSPCKLETMADIIWWLNFSCKWQSVALRTLCFTNFLDKFSNLEQLGRFKTFFNTPEFQVGAITNSFAKWGTKPAHENYKMASRTFIEAYAGLDKYCASKIKVPSLYRVLVSGDYKYSALGVENGKIYQLTSV